MKWTGQTGGRNNLEEGVGHTEGAMMGREESKEAGMTVDNARYDADLGKSRREALVDTSDEYETEVIEGLEVSRRRGEARQRMSR